MKISFFCEKFFYLPSLVCHIKCAVMLYFKAWHCMFFYIQNVINKYKMMMDYVYMSFICLMARQLITDFKKKKCYP